MSDEHRVKIQNSNILNALVEHVEGKRDMTATQVTAGIALLRKVLPDLTATELTGKDGSPLSNAPTILFTGASPGASPPEAVASPSNARH